MPHFSFYFYSMTKKQKKNENKQNKLVFKDKIEIVRWSLC